MSSEPGGTSRGVPGPRLIDRTDRDRPRFGLVACSPSTERTFELESGGTEPLVIEAVEPSRRSVVAKVFVEDDHGETVEYAFGTPIPVGRRIHLVVKSYRSTKDDRERTLIDVRSNDPRGVVRLELEDREPPFTVHPRYVNFGQVSMTETVTRTATIRAAEGTRAVLELDRESLLLGVTCELTPVDPDVRGAADRWSLELTLGPNLAEGNFARSLTLTSDAPVLGAEPNTDGTPVTHRATLTLSAQVVGVFSLDPPYVSLGLVRPEQVVIRELTVDCHDELYSLSGRMPRVRIVGPAIPGTAEFREWEYADLFTATIRPLPERNSAEIELCLEGLPQGTTGSFRGTMLIELDHPDEDRIAVVITGVCRDR